MGEQKLPLWHSIYHCVTKVTTILTCAYVIVVIQSVSYQYT